MSEQKRRHFSGPEKVAILKLYWCSLIWKTRR